MDVTASLSVSCWASDVDLNISSRADGWLDVDGWGPWDVDGWGPWDVDAWGPWDVDAWGP